MRLELHYPTKPYFITQYFGENKPCIEDNPALQLSKRKIVGSNQAGVCPPGYKKLYAVLGMRGHNGLDSIPGNKEPIFHCGPDGIVHDISTEVERGLGVEIVSDDRFEMDEYGKHFVKMRYWHLERYLVKKGDLVRTGQLIGYGDSTGISGGAHLHFEVKSVEPMAYLDYLNTHQNNGYFGAINPEPFFTGAYATDFPKIMMIGNALLQILKKTIELVKGRSNI